jgi:4-hydroxy-tetrahydrodipicolinate synthase
VVTPYYSKPPQRAIVRHVQEIAAATDKPIVVYNIPARVVIDIESPTMLQLGEIENVAAVKQAHDDLEEARFIAQETRLDLYSGDDNITLEFLELGGVGVVSVIGHVWGEQMKRMIRLHAEGDLEGARAVNEELRPAYELLKVTTNPIGIKTALNLLGRDVGGFRLPMVEATEEETERIRGCLERGGVLTPA